MSLSRSNSKTTTTTNKQPILSASKSTPPLLQSTSSKLHIGDRVQINSLQGIIRFIGTTTFKAGTWAGIELDHIGLGKNDGSVDGKRYFLCPPNTGLFILAIKVIKQQHHLLLQNRPSTPHQSKTKHSLPPPPPPPPLPSFSSPLRSVLPNLPKKVIDQDNNELLLLKKKMDALETENRILKQQNTFKRIQFLEQTVIDVKKAGMDSIEILESIVQSKQNIIHNLQDKVNELRKAGLEAIESYESTLFELNKSTKKQEKLHFNEIQLLLKDIDVLEIVLQNKMENQLVTEKSLKKERQNNTKLIVELKGLKYQLKLNDYRHSFIRLDTPIEEVDEEEQLEPAAEEEDLLDDNILSVCALCEKKGHDLIHCHIITAYNNNNTRNTI